MLDGKSSNWFPIRDRDPRRTEGFFSLVGYFLIFFISLFAGNFILQRLGFQFFLVAIVGLIGLSIYGYFSFRSIIIPFAVWLFSVGGLRFLWSIQAPLLPDLYLDRMAMIWLVAIFTLKLFFERRFLKSPYIIEMLMLLHSSYLLLQIYGNEMKFFHTWTMGYLIPFAAYFLAKNIVLTTQLARKVLLWLLILSIYYNITSIAEKFDIYWLIWPKYMLTDHEIFVGRSSGPFRQAPLFGTIIGMMLPIHFYFMSQTQSKFLRTLLYGSFALGLAGLYFTYTRGSWLAGFFSIGTALFLNRRHYLKMVAPALVVVSIGAFMFLGLSQDKFMRERLENESTLDSRVGTLVTAINVWKSNPLFGVGFFKYREVREEFVDMVDVPVFGTIRMRNMRNTVIHDIYLGPLAENGLIGAILQGLIYFLIFRTFLVKLKWRESGNHFATFIMPILGGIFVGYLVGGIAIDYRFFSFVGTLFYTGAGILDGYQIEADHS
jgi:O-antigen ligase